MSWFKVKSKATPHRYVEDRLSAYLDGELSPRETDAVKQHLAACRECQCCLDNLQQTIQWTRELPKAPVPRAFVVPAAARPVRVPQRRRNLLPLLQGATALVALLLVFAVAGDALLTGFLPAAAPAPAAMKELAPQVVEVTREIEANVEAPAAEGARSAVDAQAAAAATAVPAPAEPVPAQPLAEEKAMVAAAPPTEEAQVSAMTAPPGMGGGEEAPSLKAAPEPEVSAAEAVTVETYAAAEEVIVAAAEAMPDASAAEATEALAAVSAEPTMAALAVEAPESAAAPQPEEAVAVERAGASAPPRFARWLRLAEVVFGIAFIMLGIVTIVAMMRRRRAV